MAHDILAALRDNLLLRASVATVAGIVLLGVASGALPLTCFAGLAACRTEPVLEQTVAPVTPVNTASPDLKKAVETKVASVAGPTLTHNDVLGATFAMLDVELSPPPDDTELKTRKVSTISIGPDGQPVLPTSQAATPPQIKVPAQLKQLTVQPLVAEASTEPKAGSPLTHKGFTSAGAPAASASQEVASADGVPLPKARPHEEAVASELAVKPPPPAPGATVKGSGANVHSSASKKSKVLFAIGPGTKLTVSASDHGWLKISDGKGHTGWVWEELVTRN
jgi:hypothetical protein